MLWHDGKERCEKPSPCKQSIYSSTTSWHSKPANAFTCIVVHKLTHCNHFGLGHLFRGKLSKFKWAFPCFWGGLNACPDDLGHLFTATTVILQIFSNWSQSAQSGPAQECPVECGWVGQILFGQCPNVGGVNAKGSSLTAFCLPCVSML